MTSPTWPGGPTSPNLAPNVGVPYPAVGAGPVLRRTNWFDAVLFAVASSTVAGTLWWAVVAFTKTQFVYGALAVGAFVGFATALGARRTGVGTAILAGVCTLAGLVVAEYFIQRTLAIDDGLRGIPLWDGFGFARDVVKAGLEDNGATALFWGLAVVAAAFTNAKY